MTTVREARIEAALKAIQGAHTAFPDPATGKSMNIDLAIAVVDALFPPDPMIDNAQLPEIPEHRLEDRHGWPVCRCGYGVVTDTAQMAEAAVEKHIEEAEL